MAKKNSGRLSLTSWGSDLPAGIVVFLVALPLCLGIALASGAPAMSGIMGGIIGGIVVGFISGSPLSVSGPAAGLTTIVLSSISSLGSFEFFLAAVFLAGVFQILMGIARAGLFGSYIPTSVIKGMLAAIGIILIMKQIPHALGYDKDFEGDESFIQNDGHNTFSELYYSFVYPSPGAVIICLFSIALIVLWESKGMKQKMLTKILPAPLLVVMSGIAFNQFFSRSIPQWELKGDHVVNLPPIHGLSGFMNQLQQPDFSTIFSNAEIWITAFTIAIIASIESLLSVEAGDRLDPYRRSTPPNRELIAQGIGNSISGLSGGLPITAVIVRSSANIAAGGKTKLSTIIHGFLLLICVISIPGILNLIPKSSLAAILLLVGYKLTKIELFRSQMAKGWSQFLPFIITLFAILFTDLLIGICIGICVGILFILRNNFRSAISLTANGNNYLIRLNKDVSFLNKPLIRQYIQLIPDGADVIIDGTHAGFIDEDVLEELRELMHLAPQKNIQIKIKNIKSL
ncbi:MAG: SulP family inorganic anion transporter [Flavobacteriales bacterium]|nr:SulP family inorganic anion transporter [Flavobacteriales bacterium]